MKELPSLIATDFTACRYLVPFSMPGVMTLQSMGSAIVIRIYNWSIGEPILMSRLKPPYKWNILHFQFPYAIEYQIISVQSNGLVAIATNRRLQYISATVTKGYIYIYAWYVNENAFFAKNIDGRSATVHYFVILHNIVGNPIWCINVYSITL